MTFAMQPARFPAGGWPEGDERTPGSDQTYPRGVPVTWDTSSQELDVHAGGATVTNVLGISLDGVASGTADNPSGKVNVALANRTNVFVAKLINGSGTVQTADEANVNVAYGLLVVGSGATQWWGVDESDTSNVHVEVIDIDTERNLVYFKFIESVIQQP
jgi:hypothetical protein